MEKRAVFLSGTAWYLWNFRRNVITALAEDGWKITVIAGSDEWSEKLANLDDVDMHDWHLSLNSSNPFREAWALVGVVRHLSRAKPQILFNNSIKANIYGGLAARVLGIPYVNNITGLGMRISKGDKASNVLAKLYAFASAKAQAILIQNPGDLDVLKSSGLPAKTRTIRTMGSGVDLDQFTRAPLPPDQPRRFLFVGRLQDDKGISDFVDAANLTKEAGYTAEFVVVGDTRHANSGAIDAERLADWKSNANVTFKGRQSDVRPYLAQTHVFVMPSHGGEGMPKVVLEAAACGRPAIVSDINGCRDCIVAGRTGWLTLPRDSKALAKTIQTLCDLPLAELERASQHARAHAEQNFSDKLIAETCVKLAKEAL
jgi:glycosyltransferase involved in cell wall biosynthesis